MKHIQNLRDQRADLAKQVRNKLDATVTAWNKDVETEIDGIYAQIETLDAQIARFEKAVRIDDSLETRAGQASLQNGRSVDENLAILNASREAYVAYLRHGFNNLTAEERGLLQTASTGPSRPGVRNVAESGTAGVLVPTTIMPTAIAKLKAFGGMRQVASQISTSAGNPLSWGTYDDTSSEGEIVAETVSATDNDDISFGTVSIGAWKFSSKVVPISLEVLQDAAVNIEQIVNDALLMRIARGQNRYFTTGTGTSQPKGVVTAANVGYTTPTGSSTTLAYDYFVELLHSVDPAYRNDPSAGFMFNDATLKVIKKLKDSNGLPLWLASTGSVLESKDNPDTFMGYRYTINQHMASIVANAKPMLFGAFSKYLIRDVMEMQMFRFTDSTYVKKGQVGFLAWARADGNMIDASNQSISALQMAAS